jgi:hypothetical protein
LQKGADTSIRNRYGGSLLNSAAEGGSAEIVDMLLERGLPENERDRYGWSPLHYAAYRGREAIVRRLARKGADLNMRTLSGQSALNLAAARERHDILAWLETQGVDPSPRKFPVLEAPYFAQDPPGSQAEIFAADIVSINQGEHGCVSFTPDGREAYWSSFLLTDVGYSDCGLLCSRMESGRWVPPRLAPFAPSWHDSLAGDVPFVTPDGRHIYFLSCRPLQPGGRVGAEHVWIADRQSDGWSEPYPAPGALYGLGLHWQFSVSRDRTFYYSARESSGFGEGDIYRSRFVDGAYAQPENLGGAINTGDREAAPYISPDGDYLIFARRGGPGGFGNMDLYVSYRRADGSWTPPQNLGDGINSSATEMCPMVSPDGKALFFITQRTGNNDIFWVSADILSALKP